MKVRKSSMTIALAIALLGVLVPASAQGAAYRHYVACGLSKNAKPSHVCQKKRDKGAFFRSNRGDRCVDPDGNPIICVYYTVCVKFPTKKNLCAPKQQAEKGILYVNEITSNIPGVHRVTWFVQGKQVGAFSFTVPR